MQPNGPSFETQLPHRAGPILEGSLVGRCLTWLTETWFRFNVLVTWVFVVFSLAGSALPPGTKLGAIAVSPVTAVIAYLLLAAMIQVASFAPLLKYFVGFARLSYFSAFSRLVAQPIRISTPAWY